MQIPAIGNVSAQTKPGAGFDLSAVERLGAKSAPQGEARQTFDQFVGETFYGQMLSAMRKTVDKAAYFDGGRAEEIFRGQLDQVIAEKLAATNASSFSGPMFELFALHQK